MLKSPAMKRLCVLIFFGLCVTLGLTNCRDKKSAPPPIPVVQVLEVKTTNIPLTKKYIAISQSMASVDIRARVQGFLTKMNFIEGAAVKKGDELYVIDPSSFIASLNLAQGQLAAAIAQKEYQQVQYARLKNLVAKGDVSKSNYDKTSSDYSAAIAQVQIASAQVEQAKINLSYTSMHSPIDGIIGHKYVDVGNLVGGAQDTLLANVVQLDPIYIQFSPSVEDYGTFLKYQQNRPFTVEATFPQNKSIKFSGKMDLVNNQANATTSTVLMRAIIENPKGLLLPGVYVDCTVTLTTKNPAILIPLKAVMETQGQRSVYKVSKENTLHAQVITTQGQFGDSYIVTGGLQDGDTIVTSGMQKIRSGMRVTTKTSSSAAVPVTKSPKDNK